MVHLTLQEKKVLLFLSFLFVVGLGVTVFKKSSGCNSCLFDIYSDKKTSGPLDINKATREELVALPGIGERTAENIILYRSANGPFRSAEELRKVKGVTEDRWTGFKDRIFVP
jgi:competence ComEA-like helix-hairpin-helix protein